MISVIIPIASKSKYCACALDSILAQECQTEILIVPTVSDEDVLIFLDELVQDREGIQILSPCADLAEAVNLGISASSGEYVHFCTGRETLQPGLYQSILEKMAAEDADVACFGWQDHAGVQMSGSAFNGVGNMQAFLELMLTDCGAAGEFGGYGPQLWNKVFHRRVFYLDEVYIGASSECFGLMEPIWMTNLALNCQSAVFTSECMMKREVPASDYTQVETLDFPALCKHEKAALAFAEKYSTYTYKQMLQLFFAYEIRLMLLCRERKMVKMAAAIENHLTDFYGVPYEEKHAVQTYIRAEHQQKTIAGLRQDVSLQSKKVAALASRNESLQQDRDWLKKRTESQAQRLEKQAQRIEGMEKDRDWLKKRTESQAQRIESQAQRIEGMEKDRDWLKKKTESQQQRIESQARRIEGMEADRDWLKKKTENQQQKIDNQSQRIENMEKDREWLKKKNESQQKRIEKQAKRIEGMEADRDWLKKKNESQQQRLEKQASCIEGMEADRNWLKKKTEKQQLRIETQAQRIEGMAKDRDWLKKKTESQLQRIEGLEADRAFLKRKSEGQAKKIEAQITRIEGMEKDRDWLKKKTESQQQRIEGLEADRAFLKRKSATQHDVIVEKSALIHNLESDKAWLENKTERQLQRIQSLSASLDEFQGSFLARTALKLNRLYRKICAFFASWIEKW